VDSVRGGDGPVVSGPWLDRYSHLFRDAAAPQQVVTTDGVTLIGTGEISAGQNVWQSMGGMEVGSIWGHGSYVAPDWTADWLHREAVFILDRWSNSDYGSDFEKARQRATGPTDCSPDQAAAHQHIRSIHRHGHG
jgi:nitric oxide reductase large subunit